MSIYNALPDNLKRLRALVVAKGKLAGKTDRQIAEECGVAQQRVSDWKAYGRRQGIYEELQDRILTELGGTAVEVYKKNLAAQLKKDEPSLEAARDVLKGSAVFSDGKKGQSPRDEALDEMQQLMRMRRQFTAKKREALEALPIEGEIIPTVAEPATEVAVADIEADIVSDPEEPHD